MDPEASKSGRVWDSDCGTSSRPSSVFRHQEDGVCRIVSQSLQHQHLKICGINGGSYLTYQFKGRSTLGLENLRFLVTEHLTEMQK